MFNIFEKLLPKHGPDEVELTKDEIAAQEKADRIAFHKTQVRNGPTSFKTVTAGQQRRAAKRAQDSAIRKNFKREVRDYHMKQRVAAVLRPHLQTLGLVPNPTGRVFTEHEQMVSTGWIVQRYGRELEDGTMSFRFEDVVLAVKTAGQFYESATGYRIAIPADFAVYAATSAAATA